MFIRAFAACGAIVLAAVSAQAAQVVPSNGSLYIDRGSGYTAVTSPVVGNTGDVVIALVGGSGEIIYSDGCRTQVQVGSVVTITEQSPCAAANNSTTTPGGVDPTLIIGGAAVGIGVAAAIALSGDDDKPASP